MREAFAGQGLKMGLKDLSTWGRGGSSAEVWVGSVETVGPWADPGTTCSKSQPPDHGGNLAIDPSRASAICHCLENRLENETS